MRHNARIAHALVWAFLLAAAGPASAVTDYLAAFEYTYPAALASRIDSCSLCHATVPDLNSFGAAWATAGHSFQAVEPQDTDGDGVTDGAEIAALTFPGDALDYPGAPPDTAAPAVDSFELPPTADSLTVGVLSLLASDDVRVTGYLLTESETAPAASGPGWVAAAPSAYAFAAGGAHTLWAWARDAAGNVSPGRAATVTITLPPPVAAPLFADSFADASPGGDQDWEPVLGAFGGVGGSLLALAPGRSLSLAAASAPLAPFSGGRLEAYLRFIRPGRRTSAEIVFDFQDEGHYRYVRFDRRIGRVVIGQVGDFAAEFGGTNLSAKVGGIFANVGRWHHVRVDIDPSRSEVSVFVDRSGAPALTKTFLSVGNGRVGLAASNARRRVAFDNVEIRDTSVLP